MCCGYTWISTPGCLDQEAVFARQGSPPTCAPLPSNVATPMRHNHKSPDQVQDGPLRLNWHLNLSYLGPRMGINGFLPI